jgi:cation transport ATPase
VSAVADAEDILHETRTRLRLRLPLNTTNVKAFEARLLAVDGVSSVRANSIVQCAVVHHDGRAQTREAVLARLHAPPSTIFWRPAAPRKRQPVTAPASIVTPALAAALPVIPAALRRSAALGAIALRVLAQSQTLRTDAAGVLLDVASLGALAVSKQELAVAASVVLRDMSERLSLRFIRQADELLDQLVPSESDRYQVRRERGDTGDWSWKPPRGIRPGDRVRLFSGDIVPVDACVVEGQATLAAPAAPATQRAVQPGDHVASGERLLDGAVQVRAEADAASSRLQRLRDHVQHAIHSREPMGRLTPSMERVLSLPLTAGALVLGFTGDTVRAASILQADPQKGLDLAIPLAREAALYALARQGLLASGLEAIERLGVARTLVLQDAGVLATGRWTIELVQMEDASDPQPLREWLAALADIPTGVLDTASFPDLLVRQWIRHGAVLHTDAGDLHVASPARLWRVWGIAAAGLPARAVREPLRRVLFAVRDARVLGRIELASPMRPNAIENLYRLTGLGFDRIAIFAEGDGVDSEDTPEAVAVDALAGALVFPDDRGLRSDWLAEAARDGLPLVLVHTVLRDLLPPGSLSLTPTDADAGAHGVLLGDPMAGLVAARTVARHVHRRLVLHQNAASMVNAVLMMASALRWMPPVGTALLHHGFALMLLLDSLRLEAMGRPLPSRDTDGALVDRALQSISISEAA